MKSNHFHYSRPLILCFMYFELLLFVFSFQLPQKNDTEKSIFTYALPSNIMVFLSLLGSCVFELIKERKAVHKFMYPYHSMDFEERPGMPPSYMVIKISWDQEDEDSIVEKIGINNTMATFSNGFSISPHSPDLLKIHHTLSIDIKPVLAVMASRLQRHRSTKLRSSTAEEFMEPTENYEELCQLLTSNFNIFVVTSAVGVGVTLALNTQNLNKHKNRICSQPMQALRSTA